MQVSLVSISRKNGKAALRFCTKDTEEEFEVTLKGLDPYSGITTMFSSLMGPSLEIDVRQVGKKRKKTKP